MNVVVDPSHTGDPSFFLERNTTPLFALSIPQKLAEELNLELNQQRESTRAEACEAGLGVQPLTTKGVGFGTLVTFRTAIEPCAAKIDTTVVTGIDSDLVVRLFGWKGNHATLRSFICGAAHNELSLQGTETVGALDGDFDDSFPDGSDPVNSGLQPDLAVSFDMRSDQPKNMITLEDGTAYHLGALAVDDAGHGVANWYTDLRRHDMGAALSDSADPFGIVASMFLTRSLADFGSTGPWLHDGRATTLNAAILAHGGEAATSRDTYAALYAAQQAQIVAFLENLVIYNAEEH